tara:strand:+ start:135 stop:866 length:732 start_codon:yes stop_codon:yes gene_type:complete
MFSKNDIKNMLFLDIETVASHESLDALNQDVPEIAKHWESKANVIVSPKAGKPELAHLSVEELYLHESALYSEFSKIVTISIGQVVFNDDDEPEFKVKSFYSEDEEVVVTGMQKALIALFNKAPGLKLVGHNIKGFDMPFMLRKFVKYGIAIPSQLQLHHVKPWDNCLVDTNEIWKFGSWTGCTLDLLCAYLGVPSPKDDLKGYETTGAFYNGQLERIKDYCEKDVKATANVLLKMSNHKICN